MFLLIFKIHTNNIISEVNKWHCNNLILNQTQLILKRNAITGGNEETDKDFILRLDIRK